jgi:uncharacterized protein (TIGR02145 family)
MKKLLLLLCLVHMFMTQHSVSQVSINTDGANPPASAMLEVKSSDKGFLPPKMTIAQMLAIQNPEMGLMIFNTDVKMPCFFDGTHWVKCAIVDEPDCGSLIVTYEGQNYKTVKIGTQCWFKENLNVGTRINGTTASSDNGILEKYCYNNDANNCLIYGGLYPWNEAMQYSVIEGSKGICPAGWHVPTNQEISAMINFLGGLFNAGGQLKTTGFDHWLSPNSGATNSSGFSALGGGFGYTVGTFSGLKNSASFWSSTQVDASNAYCCSLKYNDAIADLFGGSSSTRRSVRCIKDNYW